MILIKEGGSDDLARVKLFVFFLWVVYLLFRVEELKEERDGLLNLLGYVDSVEWKKKRKGND